MFAWCARPPTVGEDDIGGAAPKTVSGGGAPAGLSAQLPDVKKVKRANGNLAVRIIGARGLRNADFSFGKFFGTDNSDPFCTVMIKDGNKDDQIRTHVVPDRQDPVWNFEDTIQWKPGQDLLFEVWDDDGTKKKADPLGRCIIPSSIIRDGGFSGNVPLVGAGADRDAFLKIKIPPPDGQDTPNAPFLTDFCAQIENRGKKVKKLGLELDILQGNIRVLKIDKGPVQAYNDQAKKDTAVDRCVREGDYIVMPTGNESIKTGADLDAMLGEQEMFTLFLRRPYEFPLKLAKKADKSGTIEVGLEFTYIPNSKPGSLLITQVCKNGMIDQWNKTKGGTGSEAKKKNEKNESDAVFPMDRIVQVGIEARNESKNFLTALKKQEEELHIVISKVGAPSPNNGPIKIERLTKRAKDDNGLFQQPVDPKKKIILVEVYARTVNGGGPEKTSSGYRFDTMCIANGIISRGMSCQIVNFMPEETDVFLDVIKEADMVIVRAEEAQMDRDASDTKVKLQEALKRFVELNEKNTKKVLPAPDHLQKMRMVDVPFKMSKIAFNNDEKELTFAYTDNEKMKEGIIASIGLSPRLIRHWSYKPDECQGDWILQRKSGEYGKDKPVDESESVIVTEVKTKKEETHTIKEVIEFFSNGKVSAAGTWSTGCEGIFMKTAGKKDEEVTALVGDQRYCPSIASEGFLRLTISGNKVASMEVYKPKKGSVQTLQENDFDAFDVTPWRMSEMRASDGKVLSDAELVAKDPVLKTFKLIGNRFNACWQRIPEVLELSDNIPPFLWYADFCTFENENKDTKFSLLRVGADCPAICQCLPARCSAENPTACVDHIPIEIRADVEDMGETIGKMIQEALEPGTLAQLIKMAGCAECLPSCFG